MKSQRSTTESLSAARPDAVGEAKEVAGDAAITDLADDSAADSKDDDTTTSVEDGSEDDTDDGSTEDGDSDGDGATSVSAGGRRRILRRVGIGVVALIVLAGLVAGGFFGWRYQQQREVISAAEAALATARNYAVVLTSLDNAHIDANTAQVLDGATGEFKDMYSRSSGQLRQLLIDNKAGARGTVLDAGVKSATTNKVEVLLFVDQAVTNSTNPTPRYDRNRVAMTMESVNGRWLASKVDVF